MKESVCVGMCARPCVRACVRACERVCMCVCVIIVYPRTHVCMSVFCVRSSESLLSYTIQQQSHIKSYLSRPLYPSVCQTEYVTYIKALNVPLQRRFFVCDYDQTEPSPANAHDAITVLTSLIVFVK